MKKSLIAFAVLGTVAGAAQAASSVTLYGRIDTGYTDTTKNGLGVTQNVAGGGDLRIGLKGQEDLGNGLAATFHLEGRFDSDTGAKTAGRAFFDRESTVGLKGSFGHVRFGRSTSAMEQVLPLTDPGRRASSDDTYISATRHSNAMFYNYSNSGFTVGGDVTTKDGFNDDPSKNYDGTSTGAMSYGLFAKYKAPSFEIGAAYQADRADKNSSGTMKNEWGVAAAYTFNPVTIAASYASGKTKAATNNKTRVIGAAITYKVTSNDTINLVYRNMDLDSNKYKKVRYGLGYIHSLSKRTSVYADVASIRGYQKDSSGAQTNVRQTQYDIGVRHSF